MQPRPRETAILAGAAYLAFFVAVTGTVQVLDTSMTGVQGIHPLLVQYDTATYSGPGLEVVGPGFTVLVRLLYLFGGLLLAMLVALNVQKLAVLQQRGALKTCLTGAGGAGTAALLSGLVSAGFLCCSWPLAMLFLGGSVAAALGPVFMLLAGIILAGNLILLDQRTAAQID